MGIIAACIPTLRPLFSRTSSYPWNKKGSSRKLSAESAQPHDEGKRRLHNLPLHLTVTTVSPGSDSCLDRNQVAVGAERPRYGFVVGNSESGNSGDGLRGEADRAILKETEFSVDNRSDDEAVGWPQRSCAHVEQDQV